MNTELNQLFSYKSPVIFLKGCSFLGLNAVFFGGGDKTPVKQHSVHRSNAPLCPDDSTSGRCYFLSVNNQRPRPHLPTPIFLIYSSNVGVCLLRHTERCCVHFCSHPHQPGTLCLEELVGNSDWCCINTGADWA